MASPCSSIQPAIPSASSCATDAMLFRPGNVTLTLLVFVIVGGTTLAGILVWPMW